jgi:anti-anti-sigma regulatory factor
MKDIKTIFAKLLFDSGISTRASVKLLFEQINKIENAVLDLQKIEFISRAAAHELLVSIETYHAQGKDITLENVLS